MVGLLVVVKWDVVGYNVGQVRAIRQVKGDVKEIHDFLVGFRCDLKGNTLYLLKILQRSFLISST